MIKSESITELCAALTQALDLIEKADKDKENPHFRSKYADLGNVIDAIKPALVAQGLSFVQTIHDADNAAKVETIILHKSGEYLSCGAVAVPVSKSDAQGFGSALTYARRYSLSAAFGVAPEDDDGNAAAKAKASRQQQQKLATTETSAEVSEAQTKLGIELSDYCAHDKERMEELLHELSHYEKDGKSGALKLADLTKKSDHAGFQKWVGATLQKLRKRVAETEPF